MTAAEFADRYRGYKVRVIHTSDPHYDYLLGKIGYVKEFDKYHNQRLSRYHGDTNIWVSFDVSMSQRNTYSFHIDQLELVPDKVGPLPLPG